MTGARSLCALFSISALCAFPGNTFSHGGGLDSKGCHHDRKNGGYHCHGGGYPSNNFRPSVRMYSEDQVRELLEEQKRFIINAVANDVAPRNDRMRKQLDENMALIESLKRSAALMNVENQAMMSYINFLQSNCAQGWSPSDGSQR